MLDLAADRDVIDFDDAFGQEFFDVAVGESVSEIPTPGQHDDFGRESVAREC